MEHSPSSERGAPLCPVGHLPREGGDRLRHGFRVCLLRFKEWGKRRHSDLPSRGGDVRQDRGGRLALSLPAFKLAEAA